ncbi:MAG: hypothetical protein R2715_07860 [Ilumatobacteraceae bacterium]
MVGSIDNRAAITATKDKALTRKHHAVPNEITSHAASAGPNTRLPVMVAVLIDIAFEMFALSTSSSTSPRRAGLSIALAMPSTRVRA